MPLGIARLNSLSRVIPTGGGVTYPSGGVRFEVANSERIDITNVTGQQVDSYYNVVSAWFKLDNLPSNNQQMHILHAKNSSDNNAPILFRVYNSNGNYFIQHYGHYRVGWDTITYQYNSLTTGQWYHVCAKLNTSNSGRRQIWLDGVRVFDGPASNTGWKYPWDGSDSAEGVMNRYSVSGNMFNSADTFDGCLEQVYQTSFDVDIDTDISKFYNNGFVDFGASGTSSGLPAPQIYHKGSNIADFDDMNGSTSGSVSVVGTVSSCT